MKLANRRLLRTKYKIDRLLAGCASPILVKVGGNGGSLADTEEAIDRRGENFSRARRVGPEFSREVKILMIEEDDRFVACWMDQCAE